jgi:hypothetical protein
MSSSCKSILCRLRGGRLCRQSRLAGRDPLLRDAVTLCLLGESLQDARLMLGSACRDARESHPIAMRHRILQDYSVQYPAPIRVSAGQVVRVGRQDDQYPHWWWCLGTDGKEGWVPGALLELHGDEGVVLRDYDATELDVHAGEDVLVREEIMGWSLVTNARGDSGWVPSYCLTNA